MSDPRDITLSYDDALLVLNAAEKWLTSGDFPEWDKTADAYTRLGDKVVASKLREMLGVAARFGT